MIVSAKTVKRGVVSIAPKFIVKKSKDLMIRGGDFYAVWDESKGLWSQDQDVVTDMIDHELDIFAENYKTEDMVTIAHMWDSDSGSMDRWHKYVQKQMPDSYKALDSKLIFANTPVNREDYASKRLPYSLEEGSYDAWDELVGKLYSPPERQKIEWAIGSIISGDSKFIQKFFVFYGEGGKGKSTILKIIKWLFEGYTETFNSKALGSGSEFALEPFKNNPLIAIEDDARLDKIEDNTRLNSLVSHEELVVNTKHKALYSDKFHTMLFMGTNRPVKITDAKSGLIRRLIDISPTGETFPIRKYNDLMKRVKFELGGIAWHCLQVYESNKDLYDDYVPRAMMGASNDFYNFVEEYFETFYNEDSTTLGWAWDKYKDYCDESKIPYPYKKYVFKEELKNYFKNFSSRENIDGERIWNYYSGFRADRFGFKEGGTREDTNEGETKSWIELKTADPKHNVFNMIFADCPAQLASNDENERPCYKWANVKKKLSGIDTEKVHYVRTPEIYIHIDFDKKDKNGNKSLKENIKAASQWPPTYAEVSKGGQGLHLTYKYTGDVSKLAPIFDEDIEIKTSTGLSSLRRKLSMCNDIMIATISSGLPLKGGKKVVNLEAIKNEKILRRFIINCLNKKHWGHTAPEIDYIYSELEKCYQSGMKYDVSDLEPDVTAFANSSTHQAAKCLNVVTKMHFKSDDISEPYKYDKDAPIIFFDVEVFPNLFVLCYKFTGEKGVALVNPSGDDILKLLRFRLVGFNNRKYDNHILYARIHGYTNKQLYNLSQKIINDKEGFFGEAYNLSYTDIYDMASSGNKMSLKKWEIELGHHHQELGLPWDKDVPREMWDKVVEYCINDVDATEAAFYCDKLHADFVAREILADIAGGTPNDTTNQLTTKIIFGNDKNPQKEFVYTDLSTIFPGYEFDSFGIDRERYSGKIVNGKSIYRGTDPSEGGRVYAEPGIYYDVALLDIASMHPTSIEQLNLFGKYTQRFSELKLARLYIKHKEFDKAKELFDGRLSKYLDDPGMAKSLSNALKTAINSVYGLTSASFDNKFRDPRNVDNIVAKRGALFMIELQHVLQEQGYKVVHVKTDSIKIAEATQKVIDFVMDFGKKYGYEFEHEATYDKMCLVNESTYIAYYDGKWTATGAQFAVPYVFKTLFSHEVVEFKDLCETKSVTSALYLDFNENLPEGEHDYHFVGRVGLFCPMQEGVNAGWLMREKDGKYNFATGTKGYRWMESEMVKNLHLEDKIDLSYYNRLAQEAIETIGKFGDFEMFVSDLPF